MTPYLGADGLVHIVGRHDDFNMTRTVYARCGHCLVHRDYDPPRGVPQRLLQANTSEVPTCLQCISCS